MTKKEEEKIIFTREKHPGRIAQGHKLVALMKKIKEEILHNKEQSQCRLLVYLLSLPLVFVYFLDITLSSLKKPQ